MLTAASEMLMGLGFVDSFLRAVAVHRSWRLTFSINYGTRSCEKRRRRRATTAVFNGMLCKLLQSTGPLEIEFGRHHRSHPDALQIV